MHDGADYESVKKRIISSVFSRRNAANGAEEAYIAHVKIYEESGESEERKPRYIIISREYVKVVLITACLIVL